MFDRYCPHCGDVVMQPAPDDPEESNAGDTELDSWSGEAR